MHPRRSRTSALSTCTPPYLCCARTPHLLVHHSPSHRALPLPWLPYSVFVATCDPYRRSSCVRALVPCACRHMRSSATLIGDRILVFGGFDGRRNHNSIHLLDCGTRVLRVCVYMVYLRHLTVAGWMRVWVCARLCRSLRSHADVEPTRPHQRDATSWAQRPHSDASRR